jgi:hypothetical protein
MSSAVLAALLLAAAPDAMALLRRAEKAVLGEDAVYTLRMTVQRPGRPERVVDMKGWKKGDERGLIRYTAPPKERGTAYLRVGESTWLWLPSAEKVVRVGARQNFGGGDFSNGDIFRLSLSRDYVPALAGEETAEDAPCWKLVLKARDRKVAYDRVLMWVRRDGSDFPVRTEYYTLSGRRLKWLTLSDVGPLGSRARPRLLVMESALEQGQRTILKFLSIDDAPRLDDRMFTPSARESGR